MNAPAPVGSTVPASPPRGAPALAGEGSVLPAASIARTATVEVPADTASGDAHALHAPLSKRHSKRPPGSVPSKTATSPPAGAAPSRTTAVSGGVRSMVQANDDALASTWPKRSAALTRRTWPPDGRPA